MYFRSAYNDGMIHVTMAPELHVARAWHMLHKLRKYMQQGHNRCLAISPTACNEGMAPTLPAQTLNVMRALHMPYKPQNCI